MFQKLRLMKLEYNLSSTLSMIDIDEYCLYSKVLPLLCDDYWFYQSIL